ncbi:MAG: hypothetical protein ABFD49_07085 [Armatimonadota bacterium]|nr:hypothetical protein [bacterium]
MLRCKIGSIISFYPRLQAIMECDLFVSAIVQNVILLTFAFCSSVGGHVKPFNERIRVAGVRNSGI